MFRKKGVVIMYKTKNNTTGFRYITGGRLVSYVTLFLQLKEHLDEIWGDDFVITNVVKL